jgi:hypothetical protein
MRVRRVSWKHECVFVGPKREDRRVGEEGRLQGRDRPPFWRTPGDGQALLQKARRARTLQPRKAPGKKPKLGEKARKLLAKDLDERPWATHAQRAQFLFAVSGVSVSEATVCRTVKRLNRSRKKLGRQNILEQWLFEPAEVGFRVPPEA